MISIRHYDAIGNTPAMAIVVRCWLDLLERDLCDPGGFPVAWDNKGFVAFQDERPVGVMTYSDTAWLNALTIHIAYVEPGSRRQVAKDAKTSGINAPQALQPKRGFVTRRVEGRGALGVLGVFCNGPLMVKGLLSFFSFVASCDLGDRRAAGSRLALAPPRSGAERP